MTARATTAYHGFTRDADRACVGGVCAGIADYFGLNLRVTRLVVIIAFLCAFPVALLVYIAIVCLFPATSRRYDGAPRVSPRRKRRRMSRRERREAAAEEQQQAADEVGERCESLDQRLARIEKYVTSSRYNLDEEFRNL